MSASTVDASSESPTHALVVGLGSIGRRHVEVLTTLGLEVATVSRRGGGDFPTIGEALSIDPAIAYVVIATETERHHDALEALAAHGFAGTALVEKPVFATVDDRSPRSLRTAFQSLTGYNLRFHPAMVELRRFVTSTTVRSVQIHAGQDVRQWRPGRDVASTASATPQSGGVLRDLSHELDYVLWLLGPWKRALGIGGRRAELGIDSDDVWHIVLEMASGALVSVELNYLDSPARRTIAAASEDGSILVDLVAGTVQRADECVCFETERNQTYEAMHTSVLEHLSDRSTIDERLCTFDQAVAVVQLIDALERSNDRQQWQVP